MKRNRFSSRSAQGSDMGLLLKFGHMVRLVTIPVLVGLLLTSGLVRAQEEASDVAPAAVLAIIDIQRVLLETAVAASIRSQMEAYRVTYLAEIKELEGSLREEDQELQRQRSILSAQAFTERRRVFQVKVDVLDRRAKSISRALDTRFSAAMNQVREAMIPIFADLTRERGINVIVAKTTIMFAKRSLDITDEVIRRVDLALPDVQIPAPDLQ